ncbi:MAG: patatin-like phospholipase family protein, partial [Oligoflexus sp.]
MGSDKRRRIALVLSGGGARGAYQAGVVKALGEISHECGQPDIFRIVAGVSAGAINASYIASRSTPFLSASRHLAEIWEELTINDVFRTDLRSLSTIGLQWVSDVVTSGALGQNRANSLLDTAPLFRFITKHVDFDQIIENLREELIDALAVTATDYSTSENVTFVSSVQPVTPWHRTRRMSETARITLDHVGASAAIPLFFPPVRIGDRYFGDGCLRNTAPLSPG